MPVLDKKTIADLAKQMAKSNYSDEVYKLSEAVGPKAKSMTIRLSYLVAIADNKVEADETKRLFEIGRLIGVRKEEVAKIIEEMSSSSTDNEEDPNT